MFPASAGPRRPGGSYQRLEFLGDHVLGLVISDMLFRSFPKANEGELSRRLADLVRKETCAEVAREIDLGSAIKLGGAEAQSGGRERTAILGDVCEALIGAVFLDGGYAGASALIDRFWRERMMMVKRPRRDPKTLLQEWAQGRGLPTPAYREVARTGPHHDPEFRVAVELPSHPPAEGHGPVETGGGTGRRRRPAHARGREAGVPACLKPRRSARRVRLYRADRRAERGKIDAGQRDRRLQSRDRHPQGSDDARAGARDRHGRRHPARADRHAGHLQTKAAPRPGDGDDRVDRRA